MTDAGSNPYYLFFKDGKSKMTRHEPDNLDEIEYEATGSIIDRRVEGDIVDHDPLREIDGFIRNILTGVFGTPVTSLELSFGVYNDTLYLVDGSAETARNPFLSRIFEGIERGEAAFAEFICEEILIARQQQQTSCISAFDTCQEAHYKVPWILVLLFRAREVFPSIDPGRLYTVIKTRISGINKAMAKAEVNACISCVSMYEAEQQFHQTDKARTRTRKKSKPVFYDQFFHAQERALGKESVRFPADPKDDPYCFRLNISNTPYDKKAIGPVQPALPPQRQPVKPLARPTTAVRRLLKEHIPHTVAPPSAAARGMRVSKSRSGPRLEDVELIVRTRKSYAEKKVPSLYGKQPFGYDFLKNASSRYI